MPLTSSLFLLFPLSITPHLRSEKIKKLHERHQAHKVCKNSKCLCGNTPSPQCSICAGDVVWRSLPKSVPVTILSMINNSQIQCVASILYSSSLIVTTTPH